MGTVHGAPTASPDMPGAAQADCRATPHEYQRGRDAELSSLESPSHGERDTILPQNKRQSPQPANISFFTAL